MLVTTTILSFDTLVQETCTKAGELINFPSIHF